MKQPLDAALDAARAAGGILMERRTQPREIRFKGERDIVTDADLAANRAIREILEKAYPAFAILSEEDERPARSEYVWIVDPLDGTTNYAHGFPVFAVSIGLARNGRPELGVVYDPLRGECYHARRGGGAFLNEERIQASRTARVEEAVVGFELARAQALRERGLDWFARLASRSMTGRIGGSAALSFCYVGAGRLDAYLHLSLSPWDVAAGVLIAREGGARVTDLHGARATLRGGAYLLANRRLHTALLELVRQWNNGSER
jgi:myo-inositol-1(or 4)-monophosphatase